MNPTGQPFQPPPPSAAKNDLLLPAILLMVIGGIGLLWALVGLVSGGNPEQVAAAVSDPNLPPWVKPAATSLAAAAPSINLVTLLWYALMILGTIQMLRLKMFPAAIATCVIAIIPCQCCCLTLPIGVWALTILLRADVKAKFS
jgi:hypothetical protein